MYLHRTCRLLCVLAVALLSVALSYGMFREPEQGIKRKRPECANDEEKMDGSVVKRPCPERKPWEYVLGDDEKIGHDPNDESSLCHDMEDILEFND